jgi:hypothetical protein
MRRPAGPPLPLLLPLLLLLLGARMAAPESGGEFAIRSAEDFKAALMDDGVQRACLANDIQLSKDVFPEGAAALKVLVPVQPPVQPQQPPRPPWTQHQPATATTPQVTSNLTIDSCGGAAAADRPVLDFNYLQVRAEAADSGAAASAGTREGLGRLQQQVLSARSLPTRSQGHIRLAPNVTLALHNIINKNPRASTGFAVDILLASPGASVHTVNTTRWAAAARSLARLLRGWRCSSQGATRSLVSD